MLEFSVAYASLQRALGSHSVYDVLRDEFLDLAPGMSLLDVGAGTAALRPWVSDATYTALEPNPKYCATMRRRFAGGSEVVIEGTTSALEALNDRFDRIVMFALLHHLDDEAASAALAAAARLLKPEGRLIALDPGFHPGQAPFARFMARIDRGANVRGSEEYARLAQRSFGSVTTTVTTDLIRIPYSHVWTTCQSPRP